MERFRWLSAIGAMVQNSSSNRFFQWVAVGASALMLATAFFLPAHAGWLVFLFLVPLFYAALLPARLGFWHGWMWGLLFFGCHWWGIVVLFMERAEGPLRLVAPFFLMIYGALYAGFWFMIAAAAARVCSTDGARVVSWTLVTIMYCMIMHRAFFWIFGSCKGYPFSLPLLPLAYDSRWLAALPVIGPWPLLACLVVGSAAAVLMIKHGARLVPTMIMVVAWFPFTWGWLVPMSPLSVPASVEQLGYLSPPAIRAHPLDCAQHINESLEHLLATRKRVACVLMPESSYPFPLNESDNIIELWCVNALSDGQKLLIGTHQAQEGTLYNCISCVTNMRIIHSYVKTELFWFTEYVPFPWNLIPGIQHLFLKNKQGFSTKKSTGNRCELVPGLSVRLAICSELFFTTYPQGPEPLLAVVNDAWFSAPYLRTLMFLFSRC